MANKEQLALLRRVSAWNKWRRENPAIPIDLTDANLTNANLSNADLRVAKLTAANLTAADLTDADLTAAGLPGGDLPGANLTNANLTNANLTAADLRVADLTGANLTDADLTDADLPGANLTDANLTNANLSNANLQVADLTNAKLTGANLTDANLTNANLPNADLRGADLSGANLTYANPLADLTDSTLSETIFANVDLSETRGLDTCEHYGPSSLDVRTLLKSRNLPLRFLRGCGIPDSVIDYLPSLAEISPIQFYSVFISYSTANQDFADRLYADLQAHGVRCWFAPHHIQPGKKIHDQIDAAIRIYDRLLLILSKESLTSPWVKTEVAKARKKARDQKRAVLFPILLVPFEDVRTWEQFDADIGDDSAKEIREYFLPDFSQWKDHDAYSRQFEALLKSLKNADGRVP